MEVDMVAWLDGVAAKLAESPRGREVTTAEEAVRLYRQRLGTGDGTPARNSSRPLLRLSSDL